MNLENVNPNIPGLSTTVPIVVNNSNENEKVDKMNEPGPSWQMVNLDEGRKLPYELKYYKRRSIYRKRGQTLRRKQPSRREVLRDAISSMDRVRASFFLSQLENEGRHPHGDHFTLDDKILALVLQKHCGSSYKMLSSIFNLPSKCTLHRLLEQVHIRAGLNTLCFSLFSSTTFSNQLDRYCVLMFDEMSISPHLQFNSKEDVVEGFEQVGYRCSNRIATHVQVFMLCGISKKWKQPVYYNSVYGATSPHDIIHILKWIIREAQKSGLVIIATVSDQGSNNVLAIKKLLEQTRSNRLRAGVECQDKTFNISSMDIIPLFDVPHLFKGIRNSLLKYNLHYEVNSEKKIAKWEHIVIAYKMDPYIGSVRSMPKLTDYHIHKDHIKKTKTSYCTQVFSASVAKAINLMAFNGLSIDSREGRLTLPNEAMQTAECCLFFDQLFDSLNGSTFNCPKQWKRAVTEESGHVAFWNRCLKVLSTMYYVEEGGDRKIIPPSLKNLMLTINNFKLLWQRLNQVGFSHMMPRTFNQDPIEDFFGQIRQTYRCVNPTFSSFGSHYKSLLVKTLTSNHSIRANCEQDNSRIFFTIQDFVRQGHSADSSDEDEYETFRIPQKLTRLSNILERSVLSYICGYICKKISTIRTCSVCKEHFLTESNTGNKHMWTREKETDRMKRLIYVNSATRKALRHCYSVILYILDNHLCDLNIKKRIICTLLQRVQFPRSPCIQHGKSTKQKIIDKLVLTVLNNYIQQINNVMHGKDLRPVTKRDPAVFQAARSLYLKYKKR